MGGSFRGLFGDKNAQRAFICQLPSWIRRWYCVSFHSLAGLQTVGRHHVEDIAARIRTRTRAVFPRRWEFKTRCLPVFVTWLLKNKRSNTPSKSEFASFFLLDGPR
eukprot:scaffold519627_cov31-Prasinocladus_malaysianus.AAC.1